MDVKVRYACSLDEDEHPEHTVRRRVRASGSLAGMSRDLEAVRRAGRHPSFPAVIAPSTWTACPTGRLHVLEVFDRDANKVGGVAERPGTGRA